MRRLTFFLPLLALCTIISCGNNLKSSAGLVNSAAADTATPKDLDKYSKATFAAGCFWHEETLFESIKGVVTAVSGYAGGHTKNPTYEEVETGSTGHAETVDIYYDSSKISYPQLLSIYFEAQEDPTQVNGQGPDHGTQYRSIIFYRNAAEQQMAENYIAKLNGSGRYQKPIAAEVMPFTTFWRAENYHQHYIDHNPDNPYVAHVSIPDIRRFQEKHPDLIKPGHNFTNR